MKKISLLLVLLLLLATVACTETVKGETEVASDESLKNVTEDFFVDETGENVAQEVTEHTTEEPSTEENTTEALQDVAKEDGNSLPEAFLNGTGCIYFHNYNHIYYDTPIFDSAKGYTLDEVISTFSQDYYMFEERPTISYAYPDLGNDGIPEFAVCFSGMGIYGPGDDSTLVYILKEKQGMLELCFYYETWARSDAAMNQAGYYTSGGSTSATSYVVESGCVDSEGVYHFICSTESEYDSANLSWEPDIGAAAAKLSEQVGEGEEPFSILTICFDEIKTEDDYYNAVRYRTFEPTGTERDDVYWEVFAEEGLTLYEYGEVKQMIKEREMQLGVTDEIKTAAALEWIVAE